MLYCNYLYTQGETAIKELRLKQGIFTLVDDKDYEWLNQWKWRLYQKQGSKNTKQYALRYNYVTGKFSAIVQMHRLIIGAKDGECVDHINGNGLDNRRCNLRICTRSQNLANRGLPKNNTSGYKGVCFSKTRNMWQAQIGKEGKLYFLGCYETPEEAALAYNEAAIKYHGEFAWLNPTYCVLQC